MAVATTISGERTRLHARRQELESAVVRFAGDSGDGIQLTGGQFTLATALAGNGLETFPDFPAEIRAPVGTTFGVYKGFGVKAELRVLFMVPTFGVVFQPQIGPVFGF